jgi:hypothetical protein
MRYTRAMRRLLLVTGPSGVGKRSIAEVLVAGRGFVHENDAQPGMARSLHDLLLNAHACEVDAIVTWSEPPGPRTIKLALHLGFDWILISGRHNRRAGSETEPRVVAAFDRSGSSRTLAAILAEIG